MKRLFVLLGITIGFLGSLPVQAEVTYRGFQYALTDATVTDSFVSELADVYGINLVRIQVGNNDLQDGTTGADYIDMMEAVFDRLDSALPLLEAHGIKVIFALYSSPGGFETRAAPAHYAMFSDAALQEEYIDMWETIIDRYGDNENIYAFDLLNEPAMRKSMLCDGCRNWNELVVDLIAAIRVLAPDKTLMVKSLYADPTRMASLPAINDANIIYSYHAYPFLAYQHAGIGADPVDTERPTAEKIKKKLLNLLANFYQKSYKRFRAGEIPSYPPTVGVGEFAVSSCSTQNPAQFMDDLLSVIERDDLESSTVNARRRRRRQVRNYKADISHDHWINHAVGEAQVWDARYTCSEDGTFSLSDSDTDRATVLKSYFSRNAE